jgi:hypothetical protein
MKCVSGSMPAAATSRLTSRYHFESNNFRSCGSTGRGAETTAEGAEAGADRATWLGDDAISGMGGFRFLNRRMRFGLLRPAPDVPAGLNRAANKISALGFITASAPRARMCADAQDRGHGLRRQIIGATPRRAVSPRSVFGRSENNQKQHNATSSTKSLPVGCYVFRDAAHP